MFADVKCFVLVVLVAVTLSAPAPGVNIVGFSHRAIGKTGFEAGAKGKADFANGVADSKGSAKIGLSGSGTIGGSVFAQKDKNIVELAGEYGGSGGAWYKPIVEGKMGYDKDTGRAVLGGSVKTKSKAEHTGAGSGGTYTNEDALANFNAYKNRDADDILSDMNDDDEDY